MPFGEATSAFWFYGRLLPSHHVAPFDVQNVQIAPDVFFEVAFDGIGLWAKPGGKDFKQFGEATAFLRLVVASYALLSREALDVTMEGWVEATEARLAGS